MNTDCNTGIKKNGKLCACRLGLGHLGQHEYKEPTKEQTDGDISNEGCIIGFIICSGILALFYFTVTERWIDAEVWYDLRVLGLTVVTMFGFVGWFIFLSCLINNLRWARKPDEIWIRNKNASEHAKTFGEDWIKLEDKDGVPKVN